MLCSLPPASIKSAVVVYIIKSACQIWKLVIVQASMHPALPCSSAASTSYLTCAAALALCLHRHPLVAPLGWDMQSRRLCRRAEWRTEEWWHSACSDLQLHVLMMWQLAMSMDMAQAGSIQGQRHLLHMTIVRSDLDACN